jgi:hypothetical protein
LSGAQKETPTFIGRRTAVQFMRDYPGVDELPSSGFVVCPYTAKKSPSVTGKTTLLQALDGSNIQFFFKQDYDHRYGKRDEIHISRQWALAEKIVRTR